jgi:hypothetical protein
VNQGTGWISSPKFNSSVLYKENRAIDTTQPLINLARQSLYVDMLNAIFLDLYYSDESIKYMQQFVQVVIIKMRSSVSTPTPTPPPTLRKATWRLCKM